MIRLFKSSIAKLWALTLLLIILSALLISAARLLTPLVSDFRADIEALASEVIGHPVIVGRFDGAWRGLGPELVMRNVSLLNLENREVALHLPEIRVSLSLLDSLRNWAITPRLIRIIRPRLLITRRRNGSFTIAGIGSGELDASAKGGRMPGGGLFLLPARVQIEQGDIHWFNEAIGGEPLHLSEVALNFRNAGTRHQLSGSLNLPGESGGRLRMTADIHGELDRPSDWSGRLYLQGQAINLDVMLRYRLPLDYRIEQGTASVELWSDWQSGQLQSVSGHTDWRSLKLSRQTPELPSAGLLADRLSGTFNWSKLADGWRLEVDRLQFANPASTWPENRFALEWRRKADDTRLIRTGIDVLRLEDLTGLLPLAPVDLPQLGEQLQQLSPSGDLKGLKLELEEDEDGWLWRGEVTAERVNTKPWQQIPGVENLSAKARFSHTGGMLSLDSRDLSLDFSDLFRGPLTAQLLQGDLHWRREANGDWQIDSSRLQLDNDHLQTRSRVRLLLPADPEASPFLDLQTDFHDGDGSQASHYYPVGVMQDDLVRWLDRSIQGGQVVSGGCLFRGALSDFPFSETQSGRFEVFFEIEDAVLAYMPEWPPLEQLHSEIRFLNDRFDAWLKSGRIYNSQVLEARASIRDLFPATAVEIDGKLSGPFADTLKLLRETPLAERFDEMTDGLTAQGNSTLALDFAVPLRRGDWRLDGQLRFDRSRLDLTDWNLPIRQIEGTLGFDLDHVFATGIRGQALGSEISVDVVDGDPGSPATRIQASGVVASDRLGALFPALDLSPVQGKSLWQLQLDIPHSRGRQQEKARLALRSDLQGVAVDLPQPLGKTADTSAHLEIATRFTGTQEQTLQIGYADLLRSVMQLDKGPDGRVSVKRATIGFGEQPVSLPEQQEINLTGHWKEIDLAAWLTLAGGTRESGSTLPFGHIDVGFDQAGLGDMRLEGLRLDLRRDLHKGRSDWRGSASSDLFSGDLVIPDDLQSRPVTMHLERLNLQLDPDRIEEGSERIARESPDPWTLPEIDLQVDQLMINDRDYGRAQLRTSRIPHGLKIEQAVIDSDKLSLEVGGSWTRPPGSAHDTRLDIRLNSQDFGDLIADLGFARNLEEASARITGSVNWPESPMGFSRTLVQGRLDLRLDQGRFLNVDPGIGRIFGLLNLSALQRRLSLDFSDMLEKGLAFDRITGLFYLDNGDAYTHNFELKGPATLIEISGRTGLAREDFDQLVTVTPYVTSSAPVAGALAGGPVVGAALFLAQRLFGKQIDRITQRQYLVTGSWDDPSIERLIKTTEEEDESE